MSKEYTVKAQCPHCGHEETVSVTADQYKDDPLMAMAQCHDCGKSFEAPMNKDTCAEWDDFCKEIPTVPEV